MTNFFKKLKEEFIKIINCNKLFLVFLLIAFCLGLIIAIINLVSLKSVIIFNNLADVCLLRYLGKEISLFSFFLQRFFAYLLLFCFVILLCFNKFTSFLICFLTLYLTYLFVFDMGVVIICFGFFGIIFAIVNILIFNLCYLCLIFSLSLFCKSCYGRNYFNNLCCQYQFILILLLVLTVLCLLEMILLPLLSSTFIIVI